jgi:hypothetical protein
MSHISVEGAALLPVATCSSETSVDFQRTTRYYIGEFRTLLSRLIRGTIPLLSYTCTWFN